VQADQQMNGQRKMPRIVIQPALQRLKTWVYASNIRFFFSLFFPLAVVYALTADWQLPQDPDAFTNAVSAWAIGNTGSPVLPEYDALADRSHGGALGSFIAGANGTVSFAPPGAAWIAAPIYAMTDNARKEVRVHNQAMPDTLEVRVLVPSLWQAALVAIVSTAAAIGFLGLCFRLQGSPGNAWVAAIVAGLGTSAWSVASAALFQHGPAMLWIALGIFLSTRANWSASGLAFGAAILTRPHTAIVPACVGIGLGLCQRRMAPVIGIGVASSLGLLILLGYNWAVFGKLSVVGGYGSAITANLTNLDVIGFFRNLLGALFDPKLGFLIWSPFLIALLPGLIPAWRNSDPWVRYAALGGLLYLLLQYKMNRYNPGNSSLYRYPLEALTASAPLWFAAYQHWVKGFAPIRHKLLAATAAGAIALQAFGPMLLFPK